MDVDANKDVYKYKFWLDFQQFKYKEKNHYLVYINLCMINVGRIY